MPHSQDVKDVFLCIAINRFIQIKDGGGPEATKDTLQFVTLQTKREALRHALVYDELTAAGRSMALEMIDNLKGQGPA